MENEQSEENLIEEEHELYEQLDEVDEKVLMKILYAMKLYGKFDESLKAHKTLMIYEEDYRDDHWEDVDFYYNRHPENLNHIEIWKKSLEQIHPIIHLFNEGKVSQFKKALKTNGIQWWFESQYIFYNIADPVVLQQVKEEPVSDEESSN